MWPPEAARGATLDLDMISMHNTNMARQHGTTEVKLGRYLQEITGFEVHLSSCSSSSCLLVHLALKLFLFLSCF